MERSHAQAVMDDLHDALGRRLAVSSLAPCPVEFTAALVNLCSTQSCGKCTPCRVGLSALSDLLADVLEGRADESTLNLIERTARTIYLSSDCAIGYEAGAMALTAIRGFRDDFEHHIREHSCGFDREARVPCVSGCPAHVDIPGYISLVEAGRYADAVKVIRKNNPLPLVCGLVCEHPCEMHCRRGMVDDPMNILALKRFAVEHSDLNDHKPHVVDNTGKRVAVIGGGPAGLSCAYYLAVMGHKVTIFEQRHHLGGMLRYGIPSYRLPRERLQAEIDWILSAGIDVELDHSVSGEELARLRDEFDAVYLAIGAHSDKKLGLPGEEALGVESAVKMLRAIGDDELPDLSGQRVCVIGGGNVAMDVCRTAIRLGAQDTYVIYRRSQAEMPADAEEVAEAMEEGVQFRFLSAPAEILGENGKVKAIKVEIMELGEPDEKGRRKPVGTGKFETIEVTSVIGAIGQRVDLGHIAPEAMVFNRNGTVQVDGVTYQTAQPDVFAGGDVVTGPKFAIDAIAAGREGAVSLHRFVHEGQSLTLARDPREFYELDKSNAVLPIDCFDAPARQTVAHDASKAKTFSNDRITFTEAQVKAEASRCLGCGVSVVDPNKCIGCGLCTTRCEFDAIHLQRDMPEASRMYRTEDKMKAILPHMVKRAAKITIKDIKEKCAK